MQASSCPCVGGGVSHLTGMGKMGIVKSDTITFHGGAKWTKKLSCSAILDKLFSHICHTNCDTSKLGPLKKHGFVRVGEGWWWCWIFVVPNVFP